METILSKLVAPKEIQAVQKLIQDDDTKLLILKTLGQKFLQQEEIFTVDSIGQLMLMIANAPFLKSDQECTQISHIIKWGINKIDVFPLITEHAGEELAYRCLLSLSFFHLAMERKTKQHGAPQPIFYRNIGINTFKTIGFLEISEDFEKWEYYLREITY